MTDQADHDSHSAPTPVRLNFRQAPRLIALSDCATYPDCPSQLSALCQEAQPGAVLVVVRDRQQSRAEELTWAPELARVAHECGQWLSVADDLELAQELDADGLHLAAHLPLPTAHPPLLTRSGHDWETLSEVELQRLSGLLISPVWQARKGRAPLGAEGLRAQVQRIAKRAPAQAVYALGGVSAGQVGPSLEAGAHGVACIGALMTHRWRNRLLEALGVCRD